MFYLCVYIIIKTKEKTVDKLAIVVYNYGKYYNCNIKRQKDWSETDVSLSRK